jgi:hypothetical protein
MNNYYQALGEAVQSRKNALENIEELNQQATRKADEKKAVLQSFGEPLLAHGLTESLVDLTKQTVKKGAKELEKRGIIPEGSTENIGKIAQDLKDGGLRRVVNERLKPVLKEGGDILQNFDPTQLPDIDSLQNSKVLGRAQQSIYNSLPETGNINPFSLSTFDEETRKATQAFNASKSYAENPPLQDIIRPVEENPFSSPTNIMRKKGSVLSSFVKDGENAETAGKEAVGDVVKGLKKTAKIDTELGGEENPLGDVIAVGAGLSTTLGGIFGGHHKSASLDPSNVLNPSLQLGAY